MAARRWISHHFATGPAMSRIGPKQTSEIGQKVLASATAFVVFGETMAFDLAWRGYFGRRGGDDFRGRWRVRSDPSMRLLSSYDNWIEGDRNNDDGIICVWQKGQP